ncbi:MAG TPA: type II toxin-antitoxin system RatA family toxin [Alphaproteobacteria bacterium]|nr:type II toxin-antitoxin system RatA family toxin [Alphaproteobacteria bacterium]
MPTHAETRIVPYSPEQMFDLVAGIERYPEFLPWCLAARIRSREGKTVIADLVIGFKMIRERYTSRVTLDRPHRIDVEYLEGPLKRLTNHWVFEAHGSGGTRLNFFVDFEFRSRVLQALIGTLFYEALRRLVAAFEARAKKLYGLPAVAGAASPEQA